MIGKGLGTFDARATVGVRFTVGPVRLKTPVRARVIMMTPTKMSPSKTIATI